MDLRLQISGLGIIVLLDRLKAEKLKVNQWRDKESSRDTIRLEIRNYLGSDDTGLPVDCYSELDVNIKSVDVYRHVFRVYPNIPSPYYKSSSFYTYTYFITLQLNYAR